MKIDWRKILLALLLLVFAVNAFHEKYPDEFDSLVGGKYILQGKVPYRDWFQHHQPGAYVMASAIELFSGQSFVRFRVGWAAAIFFLMAGTYVLLRKRFPKENFDYFFIFLFTVAFAGTYFWMHMLLADTLAAYVLLPAYAYLFIKDQHGSKFRVSDLVIVGGFAFLGWYTSMTYIFVAASLSLYALYLFCVRGEERTPLIKRLALGVAILALPYAVFALYLLVTGSLRDYYWANIVYNQNYYIYNYPRPPGTPVNPIRYAIVIINDFINNYSLALWGVTGLPIGNPAQVTFAFSAFAAVVAVVLTKRYFFLFPLLVTLIFSNARSNPSQIKETDYQAAVYIITSIFNGVYAMTIIKSYLDDAKRTFSERVFPTVVYLLLVVFWIAAPASFAYRMMQRFYPKYMGNAPLIYDRPQIAGIVNTIVGKDEYVFIGPFEFEELFYLSTKNQPSKYHWFLDHAAKSKIKDEILADFSKHKPKIVVFNRDFAPWGGDPHTYNYFMTDYLDKNYFRIFTLNGTLKDVSYRWTLGKTQNFDIDATFNFDKRYQDEILEKLLSLGYIEKVSKK